MLDTDTLVPLRLNPDALPDHEADEPTFTYWDSDEVPVVIPFHFVYLSRTWYAVALKVLLPPVAAIVAGLALTDNDEVLQLL